MGLFTCHFGFLQAFCTNGQGWPQEAGLWKWAASCSGDGGTGARCPHGITQGIQLAGKQQELESKWAEGQQGSKMEALQGEGTITALPGCRISWVFYNGAVAQGCSALMKQFMFSLLIVLGRCGAASRSQIWLWGWTFSILAEGKWGGLGYLWCTATTCAQVVVQKNSTLSPTGLKCPEHQNIWFV